MSNLVFKIAKLWGSPEGTTQKLQIDTKLDFDPKEIIAATNLQADLMIIKLKDELAALVSNATIGVHTTCPLCLKKFVQQVEIPNAERQFLSRNPGRVEDINDLFLIDMKAMAIDLFDMLRQEIILHFTPFLVCSPSCKGLCQYCGKNKNEKSCSCKEEDLTHHKPFKNLKNLINN